MGDESLDAASAFAGTPAGHDHLGEEQREARLLGEDAAATRLEAALLRGEALQAGREEARLRAGSRRPRAPRSEELGAVSHRFGAAPGQVVRDHAVSHVLAALSTVGGAERADGSLIIIGGTALARTLRLSEDVDLLTAAPRREMALAVERALRLRLRRTHGDVTWAGPSLSQVGDTEPAVAVLGDVQVRFQLLPAAAYPPWPRELRALHQRYSDAPSASLCTLTPSAFVASKLDAWHDRRAARDLYDLWALGLSGFFDGEAARLSVRHGALGRGTPAFSPPPSESVWRTALAHQGRLRTSAAEAARVVEQMWGQVTAAL